MRLRVVAECQLAEGVIPTHPIRDTKARHPFSQAVRAQDPAKVSWMPVPIMRYPRNLNSTSGNDGDMRSALGSDPKKQTSTAAIEHTGNDG